MGVKGFIKNFRKNHWWETGIVLKHNRGVLNGSFAVRKIPGFDFKTTISKNTKLDFLNKYSLINDINTLIDDTFNGEENKLNKALNDANDFLYLLQERNKQCRVGEWDKANELEEELVQIYENSVSQSLLNHLFIANQILEDGIGDKETYKLKWSSKFLNFFDFINNSFNPLWKSDYTHEAAERAALEIMISFNLVKSICNKVRRNDSLDRETKKNILKLALDIAKKETRGIRRSEYKDYRLMTDVENILTDVLYIVGKSVDIIGVASELGKWGLTLREIKELGEDFRATFDAFFSVDTPVNIVDFICAAADITDKHTEALTNWGLKKYDKFKGDKLVKVESAGAPYHTVYSFWIAVMLWCGARSIMQTSKDIKSEKERREYVEKALRREIANPKVYVSKREEVFKYSVNKILICLIGKCKLDEFIIEVEDNKKKLAFEKKNEIFDKFFKKCNDLDVKELDEITKVSYNAFLESIKQLPGENWEKIDLKEKIIAVVVDSVKKSYELCHSNSKINDKFTRNVKKFDEVLLENYNTDNLLSSIGYNSIGVLAGALNADKVDWVDDQYVLTPSYEAKNGVKELTQVFVNSDQDFSVRFIDKSLFEQGMMLMARKAYYECEIKWLNDGTRIREGIESLYNRFDKGDELTDSEYLALLYVVPFNKRIKTEDVNRIVNKARDKLDDNSLMDNYNKEGTNGLLKEVARLASAVKKYETASRLLCNKQKVLLDKRMYKDLHGFKIQRLILEDSGRFNALRRIKLEEEKKQKVRNRNFLTESKGIKLGFTLFILVLCILATVFFIAAYVGTTMAYAFANVGRALLIAAVVTSVAFMAAKLAERRAKEKKGGGGGDRLVSRLGIEREISDVESKNKSIENMEIKEYKMKVNIVDEPVCKSKKKAYIPGMFNKNKYKIRIS